MIKHVLLSIKDSVWKDLKNGYTDMSKPKEILNVLFIISVVFIFTERWTELKYAIAMYVLVYVWKIIRQADWRKRMKEENYSKMVSGR